MSNDEGGGVMVAGELPANPDTLSPGSGPVDIYANQIQANLANDDGGGLRFLMAGGTGGTDVMNVYNNTIVNNVSTHEGGGIGLNDAPNVRVYNNTVMKNLTTATAVTSDGQPAPAGLSTSANSALLQNTLPGGAPSFSNPRLFNNIFWDNRAGTRAGTSVTGIGVAGDSTPADHWDLGVADGTGVLAPTSSVVQQAAGNHPYTTSATNSVSDPTVVDDTYDVSVSFATWRQNPAFVDATLVAVELPPNQQGDYHLKAASPAVDLGAASSSGVTAPATDIDDQARPAGPRFDSGSDEYGATATPPPTGTADLYFSTTGPTTPPTRPTCSPVGGTADAADIYSWDGGCFGRAIDVTAPPYNLPGSANADGYSRVDATHFYMSFTAPVAVPGIGLVADEDVVYWNGTSWSLWFDGSAHGLPSLTIDLGAISVAGNTLYFSTNNAAVPPGAGGTGDDADIYRWNPANDTYTRVVDASGPGSIGLPAAASVDGVSWVDGKHFYLSFSSTTTIVPGLGSVEDEDVVYYNAGSWSVVFDGTAAGLTSPNLDVDAFSFAGVASAPPAAPPPPTAPAFPTPTLRDNFNRANANTLGSGWSQATLLGSAAIRVNGQQANAALAGWAMWNGPGNVFGARQGAAFTFANALVSSGGGSWLLLKGSGGTASTPVSYVSVRYAAGAVTVATTNDAGITSSTRATFTGPNATFVSGDRMTALADATGNVFVWKTSGATTSYVGGVTIPTSGGFSWTQGTGGGRAGVLLPSGARIDDFGAGTLP